MGTSITSYSMYGVMFDTSYMNSEELEIFTEEMNRLCAKHDLMFLHASPFYDAPYHEWLFVVGRDIDKEDSDGIFKIITHVDSKVKELGWDKPIKLYSIVDVC